MMKPNARFSLVLFLTLLLSLGGCLDSDSDDNGDDAGNGGDNGDNGDDNGNGGDGWAELQGLWQSVCFTLDGSDQQITRDIQGAEADQFVEVFESGNGSCSGGTVFSTTIHYGYEVGAELTTDSGMNAREIDVDVLDDPDNVVDPAYYEQYDIFYLENETTLYFSPDASAEEANRPTTLNFDIPYERISE